MRLVDETRDDFVGPDPLAPGYVETYFCYVKWNNFLYHVYLISSMNLKCDAFVLFIKKELAWRGLYGPNYQVEFILITAVLSLVIAVYPAWGEELYSLDLITHLEKH